MFEALPIELKLYIFSFLDAKTLTHTAQVSSTWRIHSEDNLIWKDKLSQISKYKNNNFQKKNIYKQIIELSTLDTDTILNMAERNIELAKLILQTNLILNKLTGDFIKVLGCKFLEITKLILSDENLLLQTDEMTLNTIKNHHFNINQSIRNNGADQAIQNLTEGDDLNCSLKK